MVLKKLTEPYIIWINVIRDYNKIKFGERRVVMRKTFVTLAALSLFVLLGGTAFADCPDYKIVCKDGTGHGWYGTCWSWKHVMCEPCHEHSSVCDDHGGPDCIWFSSTFDDILLGIICKYLHMTKCVTCSSPPASCYKAETSGVTYTFLGTITDIDTVSGIMIVKATIEGMFFLDEDNTLLKESVIDEQDIIFYTEGATIVGDKTLAEGDTVRIGYNMEGVVYIAHTVLKIEKKEE
jgi:hypothetical protein